MRTIMALALLVTACGGEDEAPTCQQAVSHYYGAGCALFDTDGTPFSELEIIDSCKQLTAAAPESCLDEMEDLRRCFGGVPDPATGNADCDCSAEQDALLTCE